MTAPVGHEAILSRLAGELPPAALLIGPESVGKWLLAQHAAAGHASWFNMKLCPRLRVSDAREARQFLATVPRDGAVKVVAVNLDAAASEAAQHALLKSLEEPPEYARFVLTASRPPLATVTSRCEVIRVGLLTDDQVAAVLARRGISERDAQAIAPTGCGRVAPALAVAERFRPAKAAVTGVARAIAARDRDLLERHVREWGETEDWMLRELLGAAASGRPTPLFSSTERQVIGRTAARQAIALLAAAGHARPQAVVRVLAGELMNRRT